MKKFLAVAVIAGTLVACNNDGADTTTTDSTTITTDSTMISTPITTDTTGGMGIDATGTSTTITTDSTQK